MEFKPADGATEQWILNYCQLKKYYGIVESEIGVSGYHEGIEHLPDGYFIKPFPFNNSEIRLKKSLPKGMSLTMARTAILTEDHDNRSAFEGKEGNSSLESEAHFSSTVCTIRDALNSGDCQLKPRSIVTKSLMHKDN